MKQHIDKAYQAAIAIAAVLARTNGRANTAAAEVLADAKAIFDDGFVDVLGQGSSSEIFEAIERFKSAMMSSIEIAATRTSQGRIRPESVLADAKVFYADIKKHTGDYISGASILKRNDEELIVSEGTHKFEVQPVRFLKDEIVAGVDGVMMPQAWGIYQRMHDGCAMHLADIAVGAKEFAIDIASYFKQQFLAGRFDPMAAISMIESRANISSSQGIRLSECVFDLNPQLNESSFINEDGTVPLHPWSTPVELGLPVLDVNGVAWSRHNIEYLIAADPQTREIFGPAWANEKQYVTELAALAEKVYREVKESSSTPEIAWLGIKELSISAESSSPITVTPRAPRQ